MERRNGYLLYLIGFRMVGSDQIERPSEEEEGGAEVNDDHRG
jgi:hypothetical protein